jgi:hypothetical protein
VMSTSKSPLPEDGLERVLSAISSAKWTSGSPADQLTTYLTTGVRSTRISTFAPTPASEAVIMNAHLTANVDGPLIKGTAMHKLSELGTQLMKDLPENQLTHRSRPYGVMSSRLQINEFNRRWQKARANRSALSSLTLPTSIAEELNAIKKQAILPRLKVDMDYIAKYVKDHEQSSVVPGLKWGQLPTDRGFWNSMLEEVKANFDEFVFSGQSFDTPFNLGGRQRTGANVEVDQTVYNVDENRTRVVCFHPALSSAFAFTPDKRGLYKEIFDRAKDVLDINHHMMTPVVDGGEVYGAAADALYNREDVVIILGDDCNIYRGGTQYAFDGANWETQVGTILGEPFRGSKTYFGGMYHVPSGVFDTTIDDSLATMWTLSQRPEMFEGVGVPGIMEREKMDEEVNFMLGLRYADDPNAPRLQGLKLTQDKATAGRVLPSGRNLELTSKYSNEERDSWFLAYYGTTPTGGTLLDFLQDVTPEDFRSGVLDQVVMQQGSL